MFSWSFSNEKNRGPMWYIIGIIVMITLVIFWIILQLYFLSVVAVLFMGTFLLIENNSQPITQVFINDKEIQIDETRYVWSHFSKFVLLEANNIPFQLRLFPNKNFSVTLDIPLTTDINPVELRDFLATILPESEKKDASSADTLMYFTKI